MTKTLGIILAAGRSSRLYPATTAVSKQLLPIYDKPLIYYPLSTLMLAGIRDYVVIVNPEEKSLFEKLFSTAVLHMGINVKVAVQLVPRGLPEGFTIANAVEPFESYDNIALILGDNLFHGATLTESLQRGSSNTKVAKIYGQKVTDLHRFGVVGIDKLTREIQYIVEKPETLTGKFIDLAITGLYFFPKDIADRAKILKPSARGELEITDLINAYQKEGLLDVEQFKRGISWFDTGTADSLLDASHYVKTIQSNQGFLVGSPHEVAMRNKWVENIDILTYLKTVEKSTYGKLLIEVFTNG